MSSHVMLKIGENWVPIKVGGLNPVGQEPHPEDLEADFAIKYRRAKRLGNEKEVTRLEKILREVTIPDVKYAWAAWVPKIYAKRIPKSIKSIKAYISTGRTITAPIKKVGPWSRGAIVLYFDGQPFSKLSKSDINNMLNAGYQALHKGSLMIGGKDYSYTLSRTERKERSTRDPSLLGLSGQFDVPNPEARRRRPGETKEPKRRITKDGTVQVWNPPVTYRVKELRKKVKPTKFELKALSWVNKEGEQYDRSKQVVDKKGYVYDRKAQTITRKGYWRNIGKTV